MNIIRIISFPFRWLRVILSLYAFGWNDIARHLSRLQRFANVGSSLRFQSRFSEHFLQAELVSKAPAWNIRIVIPIIGIFEGCRFQILEVARRYELDIFEEPSDEGWSFLTIVLDRDPQNIETFFHDLKLALSIPRFAVFTLINTSPS